MIELRAILLPLAFAMGSAAQASSISNPEVILPASVEPAGENSPPCGGGFSPTPASVVLPVVYKAFDTWTGYPIASSLSSVVPGFDGWLAARAGIHNGKSVCACQCIATPVGAQLTGCIRDAQDGDKCKPLTNGDGPAAWAGIADMTQSQANGHMVTCATFKNWSHDRDRAVRLQATW
jgi:hypothetical protein